MSSLCQSMNPKSTFAKQLTALWRSDDESLNTGFHTMRLELGWRSGQLAQAIATANNVSESDVWNRIFQGETNAD